MADKDYKDYDGVRYYAKNGGEEMDGEKGYFKPAYDELHMIANKYDTKRAADEAFQEIQLDAVGDGVTDNTPALREYFDKMSRYPVDGWREYVMGDFPTADGPGKQVGGSHYEQYGDYQPILVMNKWLTEEQLIGFCRGNCLKYIARMGSKGSALEDARKAQQYLQWLIEALEEND